MYVYLHFRIFTHLFLFLYYNRYDLKQGKKIFSIQQTQTDFGGFTEISKSPVSKVPPELAKHESAQHKVSREMKRKRDVDDQG